MSTLLHIDSSPLFAFLAPHLQVVQSHAQAI
jgi:hypothetical protein